MSIPKTSNKFVWTLLAVGLLVSLVFILSYLLYPSFGQSLNYQITDLIMAGAGKRSVSDKVVIIDLDDKSLSRYGQWPWPRSQLADLLGKIDGHGAKSIALAMILAEPDRTSPVQGQDIPLPDPSGHPDSPDIKKNDTVNDRALAEVLSRGPFVLGYKFLFKAGQKEGVQQVSPLKIIRVGKIDSGKKVRLFEAISVVNNLELFSKAASFSGFLNATPDQDGVLRRLPVLIKYGKETYPSLALAAFMQAEGLSSLQMRMEGRGEWVVQVGDRRIPIDKQGNVLVDFNALAKEFTVISAADFLDGFIPKSAVFDKIAILGSSAAGLEHFFQTPGNPVSTHGAIHASMLETLLSGQFPVRDARFIFLEGVGTLLLALLYIGIIMRVGFVSSGLIGLVLIFSFWFGAREIFQETGWLFSPLLPTLVVITQYALLNIVKTGWEQKHAVQLADNTLLLLKSSENDLDSIIGSIPDIIFRLDPFGKIIFVSPAIARYKRSADDFIGQPIFNMVAPDDREKATYRVNERRTGSRATRDFEMRLLLDNDEHVPEEEERYFTVSAQGLYRTESSGSKTFIGTQGIVRDITEQKKLKERLLKAEKMEAVGNLAAGVAHDLNNILSGLVSYPDLLLLELPKDSPLRKKIEVIKQSGQKAAAIVQDMVAIARRGVANTEIYSPNSVITEYFSSQEFCKLKEMHPEIKFDLNLRDDLFNVKGSPVHIAKAFMNMIINAAEAIPVTGNIVVSSCNSYLDSPLQGYEEIPEGEYVRLRVEDNGVGIAPENLERIFEPFYTKKKLGGSGTGLGMTVIWATVKDQGGYIDLQSREGEGTRIDVYLPTTRETVEDNQPKVVFEDYLGTEHILVVDDIDQQRDIAVNMLSKLGYKVSAEPSGEAALEFMKRNPVDLVMLDMIMPNGMDGLDTYRQIITLFPNQKAVIASGFSESERVAKLKEIGAGEYVQKPYTLEKIGVAVRSELDRNEQ